MALYQPLLGGITRLALCNQAGRVYREGDTLDEAAADGIGMLRAVPQLPGGLGSNSNSKRRTDQSLETQYMAALPGSQPTVCAPYDDLDERQMAAFPHPYS